MGRLSQEDCEFEASLRSIRKGEKRRGKERRGEEMRGRERERERERI
jgi:hypothetical protein